MIGQRLACAHPVPERRSKPHPTQLLKCPRCDSFDTKFCYYNNYSLTQPRYFCKSCKRYWTDGGALRNVPVGGGLRKNKRSKQKTPGQSDPAPKAAISDTLCNEKSHLATLGGTQGSPNAQESPNFRYLNPPLDEKFSYDSARRLYSETGEHHYMYGEVRNVPQFFPGYSYGMAMEGGSGLSHYEGGYLGYNNNLSGPASSDQQAQSNNSGEMSDVLEAAPREPNLEPNCSNHGASELHFAPIPHQNQAPNQHLHHRHSHIQEAAIDSRRSSSSPYSKSSLPTTSELLPSTKSNGLSVPELKSEEPNNGVINPYDWQLISEGLFGSNGDYLYMPAAAGSWPDLSHFDSGPG